MRVRCALFSLVFVAAGSPFMIAAQQQSSSTAPQAALLLQRALAALAGTQTLTDVTLTGTVRRIAGGDDESGTFTLKILSSGEAKLDLNLSSGGYTESRSNTPNGPAGTWSGSDGVSHPISQHNLWTDVGIFPLLTLNSILSNNSLASFVANETLEGQAVAHLSAMRQFQASGAPTDWSPASLQRLTAIDLYLDATTSLPAAFRFNTHPDRNDLIDIPVEIRFSDYRQSSGVLVPFHVQKYLNNVLAFDFQISAVTLNSGLTATSLASH